MTWELVAFVMKSEKRKKILELLEKPKTPKMLSKILNTSLPNISMKLRALEKVGLVECINPQDPKGKIYKLTEVGKEVLKKIKEMETGKN